MTAAAEEILEVGFEAASLSRIAKRLDLTKGALGYHFPTKDRILHTLTKRLEEAVRQASERVDAVFSQPSRAAVALVVEIERIEAECVIESAALLLVYESSVERNAVRSGFELWYQLMLGYMRRAVEEEGVQLSMSPADAAQAILAMTLGNRVARRVLGDSREEGDRQRAPFVLALLTALGFNDAPQILADVYAAAGEGRIKALANSRTLGSNS